MFNIIGTVVLEYRLSFVVDYGLGIAIDCLINLLCFHIRKHM